MAQYEDLEIDQGTDVAIQIELDTFAGTNKDLTNHSAQAKMKRGYNSDSANTQDFNTIINTPPSSGIITLSLTNTQTNALQVGRYVYDVEIAFTDSDGNLIQERVLEGAVRVKPSVTR
jgi:hypothetical protein|tara:strand:- start:829 stop:1182 length:354 start_codon:yes stop_codon:yes gene_type:complete